MASMFYTYQASPTATSATLAFACLTTVKCLEALFTFHGRSSIRFRSQVPHQGSQATVRKYHTIVSRVYGGLALIECYSQDAAFVGTCGHVF